MKINKSTIFEIIFGIIFAFSSALLSIELIINNYYTNLNISITLITSAICSVIFYIKTKKEIQDNIKKNTIFSLVSATLIVIVMAKFYFTKGIEAKAILEKNFINPFELKYFCISAISAIYIGVYIFDKIKNWVLNFYKMLDDWDKNAYIIASLVSIFIIVIAYNTNSGWYLQYDKVYSLDSGWCYYNIFPSSTYYDIRHPLITFFSFPIWAIIDTILVIPNNLKQVVLAILMQIVNSQLLILIGLQIKKLTKNKFIFIIYMLSFSTVLYTLFLEKYQLCAFLVVLYVFTICNNREKSISSLISAAGAIPTSSVIGIAEFFTNDKFVLKIKKLLKIAVITVVLFICLGRGHILRYGLNEIQSTRGWFSNKTYTVQEKLISTTKMIEGSFIALPSQVIEKENIYWWKDLESNVSIVAICVIALMIIGAFVNREKLFTKICVIWVIFSFILFNVLNWSTQESPLFSIYFSWAIISLTVMGGDWILDKIKVNKKIVYGMLLAIMSIINVLAIYDIAIFMVR